jgi:hypothetical protein
MSVLHIDCISKIPEYQAWKRIKARCLNIKNPDYKNYGGRGISICERWINSSNNFISDMGLKPSEKHSIDRIDVNGNYEPSNCRWATSKTQNQNRSNNHIFEINGESKSIAEWADFFNIKVVYVYSRIWKGWGIYDAITTPVKIRSKK